MSASCYLLYTADVAHEVKQHQVNMHEYADDTALYLHCCLDDTAAAATRLEICLDGVSHWMAANHIKLNAENTELLWPGSRFSLAAVVCRCSLAPKLSLQVTSSVFYEGQLIIIIIIIIIITDLYSAFRSEDTEALDAAQED